MGKTVHEQVLDSAAILFAEDGYAGVSFQRIAAASGVEYSEIGRLFGSEDKIYEELLESLFSQYSLRMSAVLEGSDLPVVKVESFARALCAFHKDVPNFFPLYYRELLKPSPFFESIVLKNIRHVAYQSDNNIARGIQKGTFRYGINPANATLLLAGMFHYFFLASRIAKSLLPESINDEDFITQALDLYLNGLQKSE